MAMTGNMASMIIGAIGDGLRGSSNSWKNAKLSDDGSTPSIVPSEANEGMNWANQLKIDNIGATGATGSTGSTSATGSTGSTGNVDVSVKKEGSGFSPKAFGDVSKLKFNTKAISDENVKTDINTENVSNELLDEMSQVKPFHFIYKPEFQELDNTGSIDTDEHIGVKAQDIEAQPLLNSIISENENGLKEIDIREMTLANTAAISALINKLKELGVLDGNYR